MANLIFASDLRNPGSDLVTWYIEGAVKIGSRAYNDRIYWKFDIAQNYSHRKIIHLDHLNINQNLYDRPCDGGQRRVAIREWITQCCNNDVIHDYIDLTYHYITNNASWNDSGRSNIEHGYHAFYFKNIDEAVAFSITFHDIINNELLEHHPNYDDIPPELIKKVGIDFS